MEKEEPKMIDDGVIERVYNCLTINPKRTVDMEKELNIPRNKLRFIMAILKRQGRAKLINLRVELAPGYRVSRSFWVKT